MQLRQQPLRFCCNVRVARVAVLIAPSETKHVLGAAICSLVIGSRATATPSTAPGAASRPRVGGRGRAGPTAAQAATKPRRSMSSGDMEAPDLEREERLVQPLGRSPPSYCSESASNPFSQGRTHADLFPVRRGTRSHARGSGCSPARPALRHYPLLQPRKLGDDKQPDLQASTQVRPTALRQQHRWQGDHHPGRGHERRDRGAEGRPPRRRPGEGGTGRDRQRLPRLRRLPQSRRRGSRLRGSQPQQW